ncbi:hypothetical protein IEQ44_08255 [Nocardioides sp. Y6]|uniref:DUF4175 domain-containing protein n=1 Tax=Nocardioides malaquae TaxID=2773426 RepID=A0ABR9RSU3_9ACTN|nr:hypothetical protein [Nocardioides malaquae]MBE7324643.1 hypothetical protein [Nocardioides malaquae]
MDTLGTWLGRHGWVVVIAVMLLVGTWSLVDEQAAKWVSTALLVLGLMALAASSLWRGSRSARR